MNNRKTAPSSAPKKPTASDTTTNRKSPLVTRALGEIRGELIVARAATSITIAALRVQAANLDTDAAIVLRQFVADNLDRLIAKISDILARGAS
jgi:hypothetical protein